MRLTDLKARIPGFKEAQDREHLNRALAFANVPWTLLGCEVVQLTPRHRLEMQLGGNAFARGLAPLQGDVFQFLWRLNPAFQARLTTIRSFRAYRRLKQAVRGIPTERAAREIAGYLAAMLQDMPEVSTNGSDDTADNYVHWMAVESLVFMTGCGLKFAEYLDTPYLVLQQWHRARQVGRDNSPPFINESDRIANRWFSTAKRREN